MENANITAEVVEANEFPDRSRKYAVRGVPKTVIETTGSIEPPVEFVGAQPEPVQVQALLRAAGAEESTPEPPEG